MPRVTPYAALRYPLPTEVADIATQTQNLAADLETACNSRDTARTNALHRPQVSMFANNTTTSVVKGTITTLTNYDTLYYDTVGMANTTTGVLTCVTAGMYAVTAQFTINYNASVGTATYIWGGISKNAATTPPGLVGSQAFLSNSSQIPFMASGLFLLAVGDTLRSIVQWSGSGAGPATWWTYSLAAAMICTNP